MSDTEWCPKGHRVLPGVKYCPECGASLAGPQPHSAPELPAFDQGSPWAPTPDGFVNVSSKPPRKRRRKLIVAVALLVILLGSAGAAVWYFEVRTTDEDRYVSALRAKDLLDDFGSEDAALAQGRAFCSKLDTGSKLEGFQSQQVAVTHLCPKYSKGFEVLPTPEELEKQLTTKLREDGLGGKFSSDAAAVSYAQSICGRLKAGGKQQGPEVDTASVSVYCKEYLTGFKTLRPIKVSGTFALIDTSASYYFPSIRGSNSSCSGTGGYSDISPGRQVTVKNNAGTVLTTTQLGRGHGVPPVTCRFSFKFTVMDGAAGGYTITVADRGELHFSAAQLKIPGSVAITLGD